jgi:hypothetical protein
MIRIDQLHDDQLEQIGLRWTPLSEIYDEDDLEGADGIGEVLCYDGFSLDPIVIVELERMINENATRDSILLFLHEFADDCLGVGWED